MTVVCKYAIQWFISSTDSTDRKSEGLEPKPMAMYASAELFVLILLSLS
jgi:hypothetical protein